MVKGILLSSLFLLGWTFIQILVFHLASVRQLFRTLTLLYFVSLPLYVVCYLRTSPTLGFLPQSFSETPLGLGLSNGIFLYLLFYVTYVAFFYYVDRPLTLRMLIAFFKAPDESLSLSEIKTIYGLKYMIERRLQGMKDGGLVVEKQGKYFLTPKGKRLGSLFDFGRRLLKSHRGGRDGSFVKSGEKCGHRS